jgi:hypothetical protein
MCAVGKQALLNAAPRHSIGTCCVCCLLFSRGGALKGYMTDHVWGWKQQARGSWCYRCVTIKACTSSIDTSSGLQRLHATVAAHISPLDVWAEFDDSCAARSDR